MARLSVPAMVPVYSSAARWVDAGLRHNDSLFTPGAKVWTARAVDELVHAFVDNPDESDDTYERKLARQLKDVSPVARQLMAELEFVRLMVTERIRAVTKRALIEAVLRTGAPISTVPEECLPALNFGFCNPGAGFNTQKFMHTRFLLTFIAAWKKQPSVDTEQALTDPWLFKDAVFAVEAPKAKVQQNALLHLVFPDTFEPIVADRHKKEIIKAFSDRMAEELSEDRDRSLLQIRNALTGEFGKGFSWYQRDVMALWSEKAGPAPDDPPATWAELVGWAQRFRRSPEFEGEERTYKLEIAASLGAARDALLRGDSKWRDLLTKVFSRNGYNLTAWQNHQRLLQWVRDAPVQAETLMKRAWSETEPRACVASIAANLPTDILSGEGGRVALGSVLAMALGAENAPPFRTWPFRMVYGLVGFDFPLTGEPSARYDKAMAFLDHLLEQDAAAGSVLKDRLDAQSVIWMMANERQLASWSDEERAGLMTFLKGDGPPPPPPPPPEGLEELADELSMDAAFLNTVVELLKHKKQVVFYGPPGTGKTYVAKKLAQHLAADSHRVLRVQLHPSFAYEDFVEGYRPTVGSQGGFEIVRGPLRRIADQARNAPDKIHVLLIDELNRGNVAKVFGELFYLLEYRDEGISLQYSGDEFSLPQNLLILATMNTADRSIALVDGALRRRFHFVGFVPDQEPVKGLLDRWLEANHPQLRWVAAIVEAANKKLASPHLAIGPSHFMRPDLTERWVGLIWQHSILPYLEEQFFGDESRLEEFSLDRLEDEIGRGDVEG